jgi:hypothetical protein
VHLVSLWYSCHQRGQESHAVRKVIPDIDCQTWFGCPTCPDVLRTKATNQSYQPAAHHPSSFFVRHYVPSTGTIRGDVSLPSAILARQPDAICTATVAAAAHPNRPRRLIGHHSAVSATPPYRPCRRIDYDDVSTTTTSSRPNRRRIGLTVATAAHAYHAAEFPTWPPIRSDG